MPRYRVTLTLVVEAEDEATACGIAQAVGIGVAEALDEALKGSGERLAEWSVGPAVRIEGQEYD